MPKKKVVEDKKDIVVDEESIKKDLMAYVDSEMDKRFEKVLNDKLKKEFIEEVDKANKRLIRLKNRKILVKNIFLILFFGIICFLVYLLYTVHYFDRFFVAEEKVTKEEVVEKTVPVQEEVSLEQLKEQYGSYIDLYTISEKSIYLEDFYNGKLSDELKNYYTLNAIDFSKLAVEDDYHMIDSSIMKEVCSELFRDSCNPVNFDYNGNKVRYFEKLDSYITNSLLVREESLIQREILDISLEKDEVVITTVEGVVLDNQLYKVQPNTLVGEYYGDGLLPHKEDLNIVVYHFQNQKLVSIERG